MIKEGFRLIKKRTWIPVAERMPDDYVKVIVFYPFVGNEGEPKHSLVTIDYAVQGKFVYEDTPDTVPYFGKASHWMPLPNSPKVTK